MFKKCESLTSISIPDGVTRIPEEAFYGCSSLTLIFIPDSVRAIGDFAFDRCPRVTFVCSEGSFAHKYCVKENAAFLSDYPGGAEQRADAAEQPG